MWLCCAWFLLAVVGLASLVRAQPVLPHVTRKPCEGFLQCWLASLEFLVIPDVTVTIPATPLPGMVVLSVRDFRCVGVELDAIASSTVPDLPLLSLVVRGIGTTCGGTWGLVYDTLQGNGSLVAAINQTSLNISAALLSTDGDFATSAQARGCALALNVQLTFNGTGVVAGLFELFEKTMSTLINEKVPIAVCNSLDTWINQNITSLLQTINTELQDTVLKPPSPLPSLPDQPFVVWSASPVFQAIDSLLNGFFLANADSVNCLVRDLLFPQGGDSLTLVMKPGSNSTKVLPGVGIITVIVPNITFIGLDTLTTVEVLHAAEQGLTAASLRTEIGLRWLNVSANMILLIDPFEILPNQTIFEAFQLNVSLQHPTMIVDSDLAVRLDLWEILRVDQVFPDPYMIPNGTCK
jgi:hypothetical protein